jgi:hypothetical protein
MPLALSSPTTTVVYEHLKMKKLASNWIHDQQNRKELDRICKENLLKFKDIWMTLQLLIKCKSVMKCKSIMKCKSYVVGAFYQKVQK